MEEHMTVCSLITSVVNFIRMSVASWLPKAMS